MCNWPDCMKKCPVSLLMWGMEKNTKVNYHLSTYDLFFTKRLKSRILLSVEGKGDS